jgi:hypothetical protein
VQRSQLLGFRGRVRGRMTRRRRYSKRLDVSYGDDEFDDEISIGGKRTSVACGATHELGKRLGDLGRLRDLFWRPWSTELRVWVLRSMTMIFRSFEQHSNESAILSEESGKA